MKLRLALLLAAALPTGVCDDAVGGSVDRRADRAGNIDAGMHRRGAAKRIGANAEIAGERKRVNRLDRRDRDHALLSRVKLLPGLEQRAELRVGAEIGGSFLGVRGDHRTTGCREVVRYLRCNDLSLGGRADRCHPHHGCGDRQPAKRERLGHHRHGLEARHDGCCGKFDHWSPTQKCRAVRFKADGSETLS